MQLALRPENAIGLKASRIEKAPWFEIRLFKTRLRFRNPKASAKAPSSLYAEPRDLRPFVNTESKRDYWDAEGIPCHLDIYQNHWAFRKRRWYTKPSAVLNFNLSATAVMGKDRVDYPDLYQPEIGAAWVAYEHRRLMASSSQFSFAKLESGDVEVVIDDNINGEQALAEQASLPVDILSLQGHVAYRTAPAANEIEILIPFTKTDVLRFSYDITGTDVLPDVARKKILQQASQFANEMVQTISLEYPKQKLRAM